MEKKLLKKAIKKKLTTQNLSVKSHLASSPRINQVVADKLTTPIAAATTSQNDDCELRFFHICKHNFE